MSTAALAEVDAGPPIEFGAAPETPEGRVTGVFEGEGRKVTMAFLMGDVGDFEAGLQGLMRAAQAGDGEAYRTLLTAITPRIRRVIRSRRAFLGTADVEDLVQEVLLSVHAVRATYDPARPFMPWLLAIVRHRMVDAARQYSRRGAREVAVEDFDVTFADVTTNTKNEGADDVEALAHAIQALPAGQRQAIELLKIQELSLKEAAAATGSSVSALKVATHRAMGSLRRLLGARTDDED